MLVHLFFTLRLCSFGLSSFLDSGHNFSCKRVGALFHFDTCSCTHYKWINIFGCVYASQISGILHLENFLNHVFLVHLSRSLPLLLPAVEDGIFNDSWRIRQSSVELLGDLLFKVIIIIFALLPLVWTPPYSISFFNCHLGCWNIWKSTSWGW